MNRLRNAYVDLDPGMEPYLVTSRYDDAAGLSASYLMGRRRSTASHALASTGMFVTVVNAIVAGTLGALITLAAEAPVWLIAVIGAVSDLAYLAAALGVATRRFGSNSIESRFPSPG